MKRLIALWACAANELAVRCHTSTILDLKKVQERSKQEGLSFLTITLPNFGKDFERSLDRGYVARDCFHGFSWTAGLPRFLGGFLERVFDRTSGLLLDDPCIESIYAVRQLTLMFGKIELNCSDSRVAAAYEGFIQCEQDMSSHEIGLSEIKSFKRVSSLLFASLFASVDSDVYYGVHKGRHGPGATADKLKGNQKFTQSTWTTRLEEYFPYLEFCLPNGRFSYLLDDVTYLDPGDELPVKVIHVPKTMKTPRIIAVEPTAMQFAQQSILDRIGTYLPASLAGRFISLIDQVPNQELARHASEGGGLATLDLSEASDRVSNELVLVMLNQHRHFSAAVQACRTTRAQLPSGEIKDLAKFASMGSALTFPIEAMVFLTAVFVGIEKCLNRSLTKKDVYSFIGRVRIFGDDIICPEDNVSTIITTLESYGFKVNTAKSFWTGKFRESCGKEYYDGHDVSIVRFRRPFPNNRKDVREMQSLVAFRNNAYTAGLWKTASHIDSCIEGLLPHYPTVDSTSPVLGRYSFLGYETQRNHPTLHYPLVRGYVVRNVIPKNPLGEHNALTKYFVSPSSDPEHLVRSGRPLDVDIIRGWYRAH